MYLIVLQCNVILEDGVPLLQHDLVPPVTQDSYKRLFTDSFLLPCTRLGSDELLEVSNGVVLIAFNPDLLPQTVIHGYFNHFC